MNFKIIFAAAALLATQSFAIAGIGGHYAPNAGTSLTKTKKENLNVNSLVGKNVQFSHGGFTGLQGFGFKAWVDALPFIDLEATFNIQFASYNASLWVKKDPLNPLSDEYKEIPLEIELGGTPFAKATPKYIAMNADLSAAYPFDLPLLPIHPYVGGGLTLHWNTFILNKTFVEKVYNDAIESNPTMIVEADEQKIAQELSKKVVDYAKDEGLKKSVGIHLLAGVRVKPPLIPLSVYANVKCYIGGEYDSDIDAGHFAFELGGGFAL